MPYPLVGIAADHRIMMMNQQAELAFGFSADEAAGRPFDEVLPEELLKKANGGRITFTPEGKRTLTADLALFEMPEGEPGSLLLQIRPRPTESGQVHGRCDGTPAADDLLLTEALLRAQLETSTDAIGVADWNHQFLVWNQRFVDIWDIPPEFLATGQGARALEAAAEKLPDPEGFERELMRLYDNLDEPEDGVEIPLLDGRVLERYSRGVKDDRGFNWGRAWYYRDITERKQEREALRAREELFRAVFERSALGIGVVQPDSRPLLVNPAMTRMLGYTSGQLRGMNYQEFTHPEDVEPVGELFRQLKAGERQRFQYTERLVTAEGETIRARLNGSILPGLAEDGGDLYLALVEDVTESCALEEGLRLVAEVLRSANGVMVTDARGRIVSVNEAFERITGYQSGEIMGRMGRALEAGRGESGFCQDLKSALDWQDTWEGEVQGRRKDGSTIPVWSTVTTVRDEAGRPVRYVSVFTDLTERKMLASERQRRSSAIGELGRLLAHQLNQPLSAIGGYAEGARMRLERDGMPPSQLAGVLKRIAQQASRAGDVVSDMRHFFRGEPVEAKPVGLNTLLHSTLPVLPEEGEYPYQVDLDLGEDLPEALADPVQVQECLINLITNAIEAGPANAGEEVRIRITTRQEGGQVVAAIADNGPGVPQSLESKIYQPLFTTKGTGSGLGLPICQFVAEEQGGCLWMARNDPDPGTTFCLGLPVAESEG